MTESQSKTCTYCQSAFIPNKYSPRQSVCSSTECQKKRQIESMKVWRQKNPNYFKYDESKGVEWLETQRKRSKQWRQTNPEKVREYRHNHIQEYRNYMREYMRGYRQKKKGDDSASDADNGINPNNAPQNGDLN